MNLPPSQNLVQSNSEESPPRGPMQINAKSLNLKNINSIVSKDMQTSQLLQPYLGNFERSLMRKSLIGAHPKNINFCDTKICKKVLKTRDFQEFEQQSMGDSGIKTPLSQEINENNIFDQITLKTDRVKQQERNIRFLKEKVVDNRALQFTEDQNYLHQLGKSNFSNNFRRKSKLVFKTSSRLGKFKSARS